MPASIRQLEAPEVYPGLLKRDQRDCQLLLVRDPTFTPSASWSLFKTKDTAWIRRIEQRYTQLPYSHCSYGCEAICSVQLASWCKKPHTVFPESVLR